MKMYLLNKSWIIVHMRHCLAFLLYIFLFVVYIVKHLNEDFLPGLQPRYSNIHNLSMCVVMK